MRETNRPDARSAASRVATPLRIDASEVWKNLCRAVELLDDCEAPAAARTAGAPEITASQRSTARMRPGRLVRAAQWLAAMFGEGSRLAGGLAVAAWGEIRATRDVHFVTLRPLAEVERALRKAGLAFV